MNAHRADRPVWSLERDAAITRAAHADQTNDPRLVLAFLRDRVHVVADQVGPQEVEVSQLGSVNAGERRLELDLMLEVWRASTTWPRRGLD